MPNKAVEKKVLLVDDDENYLLMIRRMLRQKGGLDYNIVLAEKKSTALAMLATEKFDICLLDYGLSDGDTGLDVLREASERGYKIPFIMLTCLDDLEVDTQAMNLGAVDFLLKEHLSADLLERSLRYALRQAELVTQLKQSQSDLSAALAETNTVTEQVRNLASSLLNVQEEERNRISREIHDQLGQGLTVLKIQLYEVYESSKAKLAPQESKAFSRAIEEVDTLINTVRRVASNLRLEVLQDFGLEEAIKNLVAELSQKTKISFSLEMQLGKESIDNEKRTIVYRILQEALTNIMRHAKTDRVDISMYFREKKLHLNVKDYGIGIQEELMRSNSLGLVGMRERALGIGGSFSFRNDVSCGTLLEVAIPILQSSSL